MELFFNCLDAFNFGHEFKRWISTFYKNIQSCVIKIMSCLQNTLTIHVSPYLFLLAVEILAIAIRENEEIKGIVIDKQETKLLQYADDTTAVLSDTESAYKLNNLRRNNFEAKSQNLLHVRIADKNLYL